MRLNMLVVEDNDLSSEMLSTLFEALGFNVHAIADGLKVLPYLESENSVDIIILDLELPGMTGDKIYKAIRGNSSLKNIPIVPFTAHKETQVADSLPANLIYAEYTKTGKIPEIIFKGEGNSKDKDINRILIDQVAYSLISAGKPVTEEMANWYMQTRGLSRSDILKNL